MLVCGGAGGPGSRVERVVLVVQDREQCVVERVVQGLGWAPICGGDYGYTGGPR